VKFTTQKETFLQTLQEASSVVPLRSTLPILSCALFETNKDGFLDIKTTDLEQSIHIKTEIKVEEAGVAALPVSKMLEIVNALPSEPISIKIKEDFEMEINSSTGKYKIIGKNHEEYPELPTINNSQNYTILKKDLNDIINKTVFAASKDDLKPALCGVYLKINQKEITAVATDGHRLVKYNKKTKTENTTTGNLVVPVKFFTILKNQNNTNKEVGFEIGEDHIGATQGTITVVSRIIKDSFPDFNSVIPKDTTNKAEIEARDLIDTLKRVSIFSNKTTKQASLSFVDNSIIVSTEDHETRAFAKEHIKCEYNGDEIKAGYNAQYLKEVIQHLFSEKVEMFLSGPLTAAIFKPKEEKEGCQHLALLMPLRSTDQ